MRRNSLLVRYMEDDSLDEADAREVLRFRFDLLSFLLPVIFIFILCIIYYYYNFFSPLFVCFMLIF
jgi:hypothetical protein